MQDFYKVQKVISDIFELEEDELLTSKEILQKNANARHFAWYVLHYRYEWSIGRISKLWQCHITTVKRGVAKVKNGVKFQPFYKNIIKQIDETLNM